MIKNILKDKVYKEVQNSNKIEHAFDVGIVVDPKKAIATDQLNLIADPTSSVSTEEVSGNVMVMVKGRGIDRRPSIFLSIKVPDNLKPTQDGQTATLQPGDMVDIAYPDGMLPVIIGYTKVKNTVQTTGPSANGASDIPSMPAAKETDPGFQGPLRAGTSSDPNLPDQLRPTAKALERASGKQSGELAPMDPFTMGIVTAASEAGDSSTILGSTKIPSTLSQQPTGNLFYLVDDWIGDF